MTLKDYVNFKLTHADKTAEAEGYPLTMQNCKANKKMKQLEIYGNSVQDGTPTPDAPIEVQSVGELVTDVNDVNYGKYKIPLVQRGINLFNSDLWLSYFDKLSDDSYHSNRQIQSTFKVPFALRAGIYTISLDVKCPVNTNYRPIFQDKDNNVLFSWYIKSGTGDWISIKNTFTINKDAAYMNWDYSAPTNDLYFRNFRIVSGTQDLPYEPYVEPITTNIFLDEPLRKIGDYADYVDFNDKKVVRTIAHEKITVVAGKSSQGLLFLSTISQRPLLIGATNDPIGYAVSNKFKQHERLYSMLLTAKEPLIQTYISTNGAFRAAYVFGDSSITDAAKAQEAIGDGFEMYYVLATPTEEPITCELPKLTAKTTIIEVDTSLAPSNAYGKYIKR